MTDLTNKKFGKLLVLGREDVVYEPRWVCRCDCGRLIVRVQHSLTNGAQKACSTCMANGDYPHLTPEELSKRLKKAQKDNRRVVTCEMCGTKFEGACNAQYCEDCRRIRRKRSKY